MKSFSARRGSQPRASYWQDAQRRDGWLQPQDRVPWINQRFPK